MGLCGGRVGGMGQGCVGEGRVAWDRGVCGGGGG